jgi:hypothetical protein
MPTMTTEEILAELVRLDGAILYWQVPLQHEKAWKTACEREDILFDWQTDCYVHPDAERISTDGEPGAYVMKKPA